MFCTASSDGGTDANNEDALTGLGSYHLRRLGRSYVT